MSPTCSSLLSTAVLVPRLKSFSSLLIPRTDFRISPGMMNMGATAFQISFPHTDSDCCRRSMLTIRLSTASSVHRPMEPPQARPAVAADYSAARYAYLQRRAMRRCCAVGNVAEVVQRRQSQVKGPALWMSEKSMEVRCPEVGMWEELARAGPPQLCAFWASSGSRL